jgi:hypothetical protein
MSTGRHSFKHSDAARLIRAAEAAGKKVKGISLEGKRVTVLVDDATAEPETDTNEWDERIKQNADNEKRTS